jgi:hypothetical protein
MWRFPPNPPPFPPPFPSAWMQRDALLAMDAWLMGVKADDSGASLEQKIRTARPADLVDYCVLSTDPTRSIKVTDTAQCDADPLLRPSASPREAAGGPRAGNILKCQRKPLAAADYAPVVFDEALWVRLEAVFPTGVCDWTRPGVGQQAAVSPLTFAAGPGGQQLRAD